MKNITAKFSVKILVKTALFTALTAVCAQIYIPLPFTPIVVNFASLCAMLSGLLLGRVFGAASQAIYLAVGAIGIPVFSSFRGGVGMILGPSGGFIFGYILLAFISSFVNKTSTKSKTFAVLIFANLCLYAQGTFWFCFVSNTPLQSAFLLTVLPFIPADLLKIFFIAYNKNRLLKITQESQ